MEIEIIKKYRHQPETDQKIIILLYKMLTGYEPQGRATPSAAGTSGSTAATKRNDILAASKKIYDE